jgi:hypothetical protein
MERIRVHEMGFRILFILTIIVILSYMFGCVKHPYPVPCCFLDNLG